jgi:Trk K+ transport system NAD-binding subunit
MKPRIIICGLGQTGYQIFCLLRQQGVPAIGVSDRPIPGVSTGIVVGDYRSSSTLIAAGVQTAQTLVITTSDDAVNLTILMHSRILNPQIRIINRLFNTSLGDRLDRTLPEHASMSVSSLAAPVFAFAALGSRAIGQLRLSHQTWPIQEICIDRAHPWYGKKLSDLWDDRSRMLIYYLPQHHSIDLVSAVEQGRHLEVGDRLIVATQPNVRTIRLSWQQKLAKLANNLRRVQQHSHSTLVVLLSLLLTIFLATLTYCAVRFNISFVDALYFSVGMITGAGGNEEVAENGPAWIKIFTVTMMLVGTGVVGICYALLNDLVLGTRFRQLLHTVPIPDRHHYIICGLGGIGIQIAKQLHGNGYEVVAIDPDPNCRFLNTARSLKIPVIQGEANVASTLETARIDRATALLAVTSNDMTNLEIALTAKGLHNRLPVVVRNQDSHFAQMEQQVFEFEAVLSPTEIAAPSFAAAALGGRIFGNGMTGGRLWVALATLITPNHPFCAKRVKMAAMEADFVPLYLETSHQTIHGWDLLETSLSAGDILYLTLPAHRLEKLWRAIPSGEMANEFA